jgi:predicted ATPase
MATTSSNGKVKPRFPDGVFFVPLAPIETAEAIIPSIAEATGFKFFGGSDQKKEILEFFRKKEMLLLMDNFEHLLEGANLLPEILQVAPKVRILVTSRERLNLHGEVIYSLEGMRFPEHIGEDSSVDGRPFSAVQLFRQCVERIIPDYSPDDDIRSIGQICRLVEGMPLGVELAAAWMEVLSPDEIASEIQRSLDFLETERVDTPDRHRSVRAVFDYTWKLLSEDEREIFKNISVFRGGFTAEAGHAVAGASFRQLLKLMNKSLIQRDQDGRLGIHELLRQYAAEKLGPDEEERVRNQHCEYYSDYLVKRTEDIGGGLYLDSLKEVDNFRSLYRWAIHKHKFDAIRKTCYAYLFMFFYPGWYAEAYDTFAQVHQALLPYYETGEKYSTYGMVLICLGWFQGFTGDWGKGKESIRKGHSIVHEYGTKWEIAVANGALESSPACESYAECIQLLEENLAISEEIHAPANRNFSINHLADIALENHEWKKAENLYRKALNLSKDSDHPRFIAIAYQGLANLSFQRGDYSNARMYCEEALTYARMMGYKMLIYDLLYLLSDIALVLEEYDSAREILQEAQKIAKYSGDMLREARSAYSFGLIAFEVESFDEAENHFHDSIQIWRKLDSEVNIGILTCELGNVAQVKRQYQSAIKNYHAAIEMGLGLDEAIREWVLTYCIANIAIIKAKAGEKRKAVELANAVVDHPKLLRYMRAKMKKFLAELGIGLTKDFFSEPLEQGHQLDLQAVAKELLTLLEEGDLAN